MRKPPPPKPVPGRADWGFTRGGSFFRVYFSARAIEVFRAVARARGEGARP